MPLHRNGRGAHKGSRSCASKKRERELAADGYAPLQDAVGLRSKALAVAAEDLRARRIPVLEVETYNDRPGVGVRFKPRFWAPTWACYVYAAWRDALASVTKRMNAERLDEWLVRCMTDPPQRAVVDAAYRLGGIEGVRKMMSAADWFAEGSTP
jgi:hypothetical protein